MTDDLSQAVQQRTPVDSPDEAATPLERGADEVGEAEQFPLAEFLARVTDRAGVDEATAREVTRAVFGALDEYPADEPFREAREQLPSGYGPMFEDLGEGP